MDANIVIVTGTIGRAPEKKVSKAGGEYWELSLACNQSKEVTTWYKAVSYSPRFETLSIYLTKGTQVTLVGRLKHSAYSGKNGPTVSLTLMLDGPFVDMIPRRKPQDAQPGKLDFGAGHPLSDDNSSEIPF